MFHAHAEVLVFHSLFLSLAELFNVWQTCFSNKIKQNSLFISFSYMQGKCAVSVFITVDVLFLLQVISWLLLMRTRWVWQLSLSAQVRFYFAPEYQSNRFDIGNSGCSAFLVLLCSLKWVYNEIFFNGGLIIH